METGYFVWTLAWDRDLKKADLIVVFEGEYDRSQMAYKLVEQSFAPNLLISPATVNRLAFYEKRYSPSRPYMRIIENKSRTTFENALHTRDAIKQNHFRSVILVTSWDHMPRSYFLLRAMTFRSGVLVQPHLVATGRLDQDNWYRQRLGFMMVYNEMLEFWGSLIELAKYKFSGELPDQVPGKSSLVKRLKELLLFKIDHNKGTRISTDLPDQKNPCPTAVFGSEDTLT